LLYIICTTVTSCEATQLTVFEVQPAHDYLFKIATQCCVWGWGVFTMSPASGDLKGNLGSANVYTQLRNVSHRACHEHPCTAWVGLFWLIRQHAVVHDFHAV